MKILAEEYPVKISCNDDCLHMPEKEHRNKNRQRIWLAVGILVVLIGLAAAWRWTPLADFISVRKIVRWARSLRNNPARPAIILLAYLIGSLTMFPITVLILATAIVFGPFLGIAYSVTGCLLGAIVTYAVGYLVGKDFVQRLAGRKWKRIEQGMGKSGIMAVAAIRLLPIAPFTIVNIVSGAFKIPLWDYFTGSFLGLAPGIIITNLFAHQFARAIRNPGVGSYALLAAAIVVTAFGIVWVRRKFSSQETQPEASVSVGPSKAI